MGRRARGAGGGGMMRTQWMNGEDAGRGRGGGSPAGGWEGVTWERRGGTWGGAAKAGHGIRLWKS